METRLKYFSFIKILAWLSAEFAETMVLLIDGSGTFDKAIEEDSVSNTISSTKIQHIPCKFKCFNELSYFLEQKTLTSF